MDIFLTGTDTPYRIDLFDDEIESLRSFDTKSQRTLEKVDAIRLLPARVYLLTRNSINRFIDRFYARFNHTDAKKVSLYQDISSGVPAAGTEYYLPLFFEQCATLVDYLSADTLVCAIGDTVRAAINRASIAK